jgi:hypothetical protein
MGVMKRFFNISDEKNIAGNLAVSNIILNTHTHTHTHTHTSPNNPPALFVEKRKGSKLFSHNLIPYPVFVRDAVFFIPAVDFSLPAMHRPFRSGTSQKHLGDTQRTPSLRPCRGEKFFALTSTIQRFKNSIIHFQFSIFNFQLIQAINF